MGINARAQFYPFSPFLYDFGNTLLDREKRVFLFEKHIWVGENCLFFKYIFEVLVGWKKLGSNLMGAGIDTDVLY